MRWLRLPFSTDHKVVGIQYGLTSLVFLLFAFLLVVLMRWQLIYPGEPVPFFKNILDANDERMPEGIMLPDFYNQLGAIHGTTMVFLAVVPLLVGGFGTYLVPLMVGAPNVAFPRLNKLGYLLYLAGGVIIVGSLFTPTGAANSGWTAYPPLAVIEIGGQTAWLIGMAAVYASNVLLAINIIVTAIQLRTDGMTMMRLPFFVWSQIVSAFMLLISFPPLAAAAFMQLMDRLQGTSFFMPSGLVVAEEAVDVSGGGSALLWQHLFWFLAHPEVYVLILPAFGILAEIIANNTRKPIWGYKGLVLSAMFMAVASMLVWAHHMYLTGMGTAMSSFFQLTTIIISIPSVILATSMVLSLWGGSIRFNTPMLFAIAFIPMFAIGGLTGLPLAFAATNVHLHDTYYVIGHFHYVVAPGTLFAIFAGIYYWFPKITGRRMNEFLGKVHFWTTLVFMNGIFTHFLLQGLAGVSRRLYDGGETYAHGRDVFNLNSAASWSAWGLLLVQLPFILNFFVSLFAGRKADSNPWEATTLEWHADSPPALGANFKTSVAVHRGPCEYSVPGESADFSPQWRAEGAR
jgi:cytochrome c oxidase subunit I